MKFRQRIRLPLALLALAASAAFAQDGKTVRLVVPFPAGGATDAIARMIAPKLAQEFGQSVIVENRTGASGQIGTAYVKSAAPDGLTYLFTTDHTIATLPVLVDRAGYDPLKDFTAVGQVARFQLALSASIAGGAANLSGLKDVLRANPGRASFGVPVVGGYPSTVGVALQKHIGVPMTAVPYRGSGPVVNDVVGGQVTVGVTGLADVLPMVQGGRARILAVTGMKRSSMVPEVPTFEELGVHGLSSDSWYAFFAPAGLPAGSAERFNLALAKALADKGIKQRIAELSIELAPTSLKDADDVLKSTARYWLEASKQPDFVRP